MKRTSMAAFAAAALLSAACGEKTRTSPPQPGTAEGLKANRQVTLKVAHYACTADNHLLTVQSSLRFPVIERPGNPVTENEIERLELAYRKTVGTALDSYLQPLVGMQSADLLRANRNDPGEALRAENSGLSEADRRRAFDIQLKASRDVAEKSSVFMDLAGKILEGNNGGFTDQGRESRTLSPEPAPQCKP